MALPEHLAELERKVSERLSEALAKTRQEMRRAVETEARRANSAMLAELDAITPPAAPGLLAQEELAEVARVAGGESRSALARELRDAFVEFDRARTQASVLEALLASVRSFGDHAAIWLMRPTELLGWASRGFAGDPIAGRTLPHDASPALARLATGTGCVPLSVAEAAQISHALEVAAPARALFIPLVLRDRIAAALYLDAAVGGEFEVEALQMLTLVAAQRLELQALATRTYTPTLFLDGEAPASERGLALWDPLTPATFAGPASAEPGATPQAPAASGMAAVAAVALAAPMPAAESAWTTSLEASSPAVLGGVGGGIEPFEENPAEEEPATLVQAMPMVTSSAGLETPPSLPDASAAEISWQMEAADESAALGSAGPAASPTAEIPFASPVPSPDPQPPTSFDFSAASAASAASEWREVEEATAPHATYSPAATQRFAVPAITHEIPQPEIPPTPDFAATPISTASTVAFAAPAASPAEPVAADLADDATVRIQRADLQTPPVATAPIPPLPPTPPVAPVAPVAPAITPLAMPAVPSMPDDEPTVSRSARTTEVAPPADLQGPGWAFSSSRSPRSSGDNALHEEARRLARLLVSEIKLYNEDQVEEGRHNRDIYHRLKDDIDRSRQIYEERVHESVRGTTDYFQQELIRSLAAGDPRALGI